jgi:hypothetical protein
MSDSVTKYFENASSTIPIKKDKIVDEVLYKYKERSYKGIETYGTTLEESKENHRAFLVHLQEELMDSTLYLQKLIKQIDDATKNET